MNEAEFIIHLLMIVPVSILIVSITYYLNGDDE
jgi:hypothetical protein